MIGKRADTPWLPLLVGIAAVVGLLAASNRGFGLTDESYLMWWIIDPGRFAAMIHPFGLLMHPLFVAGNQSLIAMRVGGILLLASTGATLGTSVAAWYRWSEPIRVRLALLGAVFSLTYYAAWILTPSYNMLANAGAAAILAGLLRWTIENRTFSRMKLVASMLVGVGGMIAFFGKPTFAALAAVAGLVVIGLGARARPTHAVKRLVLASLFAAVPLVIVITATVTMSTFVATVREGLSVLTFGNGLTQLPGKTVRELYRAEAPLWASFALLVATTAAVSNKGRPGPALVIVNTAGVVLLVGIMVLKLAYSIYSYSSPTTLGAPAIALVLAGTSLGLCQPQMPSLPRAWVVPIAACLLLPFAVAFGTANNLVDQTSLTLMPVLLAGVVVSRLLFTGDVASWVERGLLALTAVVLLSSAYAPYGLDRPIWEQRNPLTLPFTRDHLYVDARTRAYADCLRAIGKAHGIDRLTPVIDLSGGGPGTALMLGGLPPYYPWIVPNFDNATSLADHVWGSLSPQRQAAAWLVGPIDAKFTQTRAATFLARYRGEPSVAVPAPMFFWGTTRVISIQLPGMTASAAKDHAGLTSIVSKGGAAKCNVAHGPLKQPA